MFGTALSRSKHHLLGGFQDSCCQWRRQPLLGWAQRGATYTAPPCTLQIEINAAGTCRCPLQQRRLLLRYVGHHLQHRRRPKCRTFKLCKLPRLQRFGPGSKGRRRAHSLEAEVLPTPKKALPGATFSANLKLTPNNSQGPRTAVFPAQAGQTEGDRPWPRPQRQTTFALDYMPK